MNLVQQVVRSQTLRHHERYLHRTDVLPVERNAQEAKTFVSICSTEQIGDNILCPGRHMLRGKTKYIDTVE